jgi:excisionase family DNA binding protein
MPATAKQVYYSCNDAAEYTGTSTPLWRKLIAEKRVKVVHIGRAVRIPLSEIDRLLAQSAVPARSEE